LIGASFGGVLAYVMAQKLEAAGEKVALLALIDTTLPRAVHRKPWRWLIAHARGLLDEGPSYASERVARMFERARHFLPLAGRGRSLPPLPPTISARMAAYRAATLSYDPELRSYGGPAIVFCATDRNEFEGDIVDPHLGWGSLVRALEVRQTRGTHLSMLRLPHVKELAETLRERLAKARARPEHETEGKPPR
jgi:thioesterase domain-containing protein